MPTKIQFRRGTAAQWTTANPVLSEGEPGYETDTKKEKIGDGVTAWNALPYKENTGSTTTVILPIDGGPAVAQLDIVRDIDGYLRIQITEL